ncbi:MAG: HIT family protein [Bacteroidia bacterium]|nr:HIT family protein [Bacteroidia bacterium]MDW8346068.1 HIT family protein [Bacteroidia bacterium]
MASVFSKIIQGEIPCYKIAENEYCISFLDIQPIVKGHTLVVPKLEVDYIFDLPDDIYTHLHLFTKKVALALKKAIPCQRVCTAVIGLEVPHTHIHLIPTNHIHDVNFTNPRLKFSPDEYRQIAQEIQKYL